MNVRRFGGAGVARSVAVAAGILAAVGATVVLGPSAGAAQVTTSNLGLAGPVTAPCLTPSATVNSPAGTTVRFTSSLFGDPATAGILAPAVEITLYPGTSKAKKLLISPGNKINYADVAVPSSGSVPFDYTTGSASLPASGGILGGVVNVLGTLINNFQQTTKVGATVTAKWSGRIVVSGASNACELQPQLPAVGATPSVPGVPLPPVNLPGITPPAVGLPNVGGLLPGVGPGAKTGGQSSAAAPPSNVLNYKPSGPTLADRTMPHGYGAGSGAAGTYVPPGLTGSLAGSTLSGSRGSAAANSGPSTGKAKSAPSATELASHSEHSAITGLPSLLVVLAMAALSAAAASYARTFLLHRPAGARRATR